MEPEKPFACTMPDCGMTFTNEDHLHVHTKKHDMVLQLGLEQKAAFVADQTPTPTRFIRNCEEVGLFQDLQNVNPFDEGFKRAMETKHGISSLEGSNVATSDDVLHTPHLVFPIVDSGDCALFSTTNNQRNIKICRSSSDESGSVKEYETTTISKLTNEVTTISRVVGKQDVLDRVTTTDDVSIVRHEETARNKDGVNETSVSYTNNIIKIHSNVEIRKDGSVVNIENSKNTQVPVISYTDSVIKDATNVVTKDVLLTDTNKLHVSQGKIPPIMSQKSLDFVVDSLTSDACHTDSTVNKDKQQLHKTLKRNYDDANKTGSSVVDKPKTVVNIKNQLNGNEIKPNLEDSKDNDYEVIIKLPNGKHVRMKAVEDDATTEKTVQTDTKEKLKKVLTNKVKDKLHFKPPIFQRLSSVQNVQTVQNILPNSTGTLIPVTIISPVNTILQQSAMSKVSVVPINTVKLKKPDNYKAVKRKPRKESNNKPKQHNVNNKNSEVNKTEANTQTLSREIQNSSNLTDVDCVIIENNNTQTLGRGSPSKHYLESRSAASRRYRERLKETMRRQSEENRQLRESNKRLAAEKAELKLILTEHLKKCPIGDELREIRQKLKKTTTV